MASQRTSLLAKNVLDFGPTDAAIQESRDFTMLLTHLYNNMHDAKIYGDPLDRTCVKIEDILTEF